LTPAAGKKGFNRKRLIIMALGNIIGSGIFLASGAVIKLAGPAAILAYAIGALIMLLEVMFIAEMSIVNPAPGSFRVHASEIFGSGMGFVNGWMFWCSGVSGMAGEVTAAAIYTSFWLPHLPLWVACLVYSGLMTLINFQDVRGLSKTETMLASLKVISLVAFIIFGLLAVARVIPGNFPVHGQIFSSLSGFLPHGVRGLLASLLLVLFSFTGTGIIGLAVADTNDPARDLPPAIYIISAAVTSLYVLSILFIVLLIPWQSVSTARSPFVTIMQEVGIPFGSAIINIIVLSAALSGLNSSMYSASRMLFSLARDRQAPSLFLQANSRGVPIYAVGASSLVLLLTAVLSYLLPSQAFIILIGASGFLAMINWHDHQCHPLFLPAQDPAGVPGEIKVPGTRLSLSDTAGHRNDRWSAGHLTALSRTGGLPGQRSGSDRRPQPGLYRSTEHRPASLE
jgi:L-asparagine transporter-like permease